MTLLFTCFVWTVFLAMIGPTIREILAGKQDSVPGYENRCVYMKLKAEDACLNESTLEKHYWELTITEKCCVIYICSWPQIQGNTCTLPVGEEYNRFCLTENCDTQATGGKGKAWESYVNMGAREKLNGTVNIQSSIQLIVALCLLTMILILS